MDFTAVLFAPGQILESHDDDAGSPVTANQHTYGCDLLFAQTIKPKTLRSLQRCQPFVTIVEVLPQVLPSGKHQTNEVTMPQGLIVLVSDECIRAVFSNPRSAEADRDSFLEKANLILTTS